MIAEFRPERAIAAPFILLVVAGLVIGSLRLHEWIVARWSLDPFGVALMMFIIGFLSLGIGLNIYASAVSP